MAIVIYYFSGLYKKTRIHDVSDVIGRKFKHSEIVIINLFQRRI